MMGQPGQTLIYFHAWEDDIECTVDLVYARNWEFDWSMIDPEAESTVYFEHLTLDIKTDLWKLILLLNL